MINILVTLLVIAIVGAAVRYIIIQKKKGVKCIGCPSADTCGKSCCDIAEELEDFHIERKN